MVQGLDISADIVGHPEAIEIRYRLANRGAQLAYVHGVIPDWFHLRGAGEALRRDLAFVSHAGRGRVVVGHCQPPISTPLPTHPRRVLAWPLAAGSDAACRVVLGLPLREWHGNLAPEDEPCRAEAIDRLVLKVQCTLEGDVTKKEEIAAGAFAVRARRHEILRLELPVEVVCLVRRDPIVRMSDEPHPDSPF